MRPYYSDSHVDLYCGDALSVLRELPEESVQCCVTSPPYWGLRDYGTAEWEGGDSECPHRVGGRVQDTKARGAIVAGVRPGVDASRCLDCGALREDRQLGIEPTPEEYVAKMVEVFGDVRRVLRDDGTLWLNIGDSYNAYIGGAGPSSSLSRGAQTTARPSLPSGYGLRHKGLKPKDLVGIPWRVAFALQADGWYLRSDIIWAKPAPMPESVRDRPTKAHEYLFLLSKSPTYQYDADAIAEPSIHEGRVFAYDGTQKMVGATRNRRSVWTVMTKPYPGAHSATFPPDLIEPCILAGAPAGGVVLDPFAGSGTTGYVAKERGRRAVLIELNPAYCDLAAERVAQGVLAL